MSFCGFQYSGLIDTENYDLGQCWRYSLPTLLLALHSILFTSIKFLRIKNLHKRKLKNAPTGSKLAVVSAFLTLALTTAFLSINLKQNPPVAPTRIFTLTLNTSMYPIAIFLVIFEATKDSLNPSFTLFWFFLGDFTRLSWFMKTALQTKQYSQQSTLAQFTTLTLAIASALASLCAICFTPRNYPSETYQKESPPKKSLSKVLTEPFPTPPPPKNGPKAKNAEAKASLMSVLTFGWITGLLYKGFRAELAEEDFLDNTQKMRADFLTEKFQRNLRKSGASKFTKLSFSKLLIQTFGYDFYVAIAFKLLNDVFIFVNPLLLNLLVDFVNSKDAGSTWKGYIYSSLMFLSTILMAFLLSQYFLRGFQVGFQMRVFLMNYLYKKSLRITSFDRQQQTTGEIVNLMCSDSQNFLDLIPFLNILWSGPLQIVIGVVLLYRQIKYASFVGLGVMLLLMIPGNTLVVRKMDLMYKRIMEISDLRIKVTNEVLSSMKVIKFYSWERSFREKIALIRQKELRQLRNISYLNCVNICLWNTASILVALATFVAYTKAGGELTAARAFTSIALLNIIRFPLSMLPTVLNSAISAHVSIRRFVRFLNMEDVAPNDSRGGDREGLDIVLEDAAFFWDGAKKKKAISVVCSSESGGRPCSLRVRRGELVMSVGSVGSGKSALLLAILGELVQEGGDASALEDVAYVAQNSWIQNATIRDNILFGNEFDYKWYKKVIDACCLKEDLNVIKGGEFAEIGERGLNLSGGQKQRVALARAVYSRKKIYLIDDALSALDPEVAQRVLKKCVLGLLKNKTVMLNTNSISFLKHASQIVVTENREITRIGTYNELKDSLDPHIIQSAPKPAPVALERKPSISKSLSLTEPSQTESISLFTDLNREREQTEKRDSDLRVGQLVEEEKKEKGKVKWSVYRKYFLAYGGGLAMSVLILSFFVWRQGIDYGMKRYLAYWADSYDRLGELAANDVTKHILYYSLISVGSVLVVASNAFFHTYGFLIASRELSKNLLLSILRAPMSFFDTTPRGRILNRFSSDIFTLDRAIPRSTFHFFSCLSEVTAILIIVSIITPWFAAGILPLCVAYLVIQNFFVKPTRDIKRMASILLSPVYTGFQETLEGTPTLRAFGAQERFEKKNEAMIDRWTRVYYSNFIANRWLSTRLEFLGSVVIGIASTLIVLKRNSLSGGIAGLSLAYCLRFVASLNWMVRSAVMMESQVVSIERIIEYTEVKPEAKLFIEENSPGEQWPSEGQIEFDDLHMKYRSDLDFVLNGVSCKINPREKVGVVGRTGAGKSSLFGCILRINEASSGCIRIDGVDISKLGLHQLRTKLTIIPQDPVMFSGSIRFNLDPFQEKSDEEIWEALELCQIKEMVENLEENGKTGLDFEAAEYGLNLSAGERQLVCISRALLRNTKVLLLDEATSSIDLKTDKKIQETIRIVFKNRTVLTIAHRIKTIMDSDKIMVLDNGKVVEFGSPEELERLKDGYFSSILNADKQN